MGIIFETDKFETNDKNVLNTRWLSEVDVKSKVKHKLYVESYIKKSTYINLDDTETYQYRNDFVVTDTETLLNVSQYAKPGINESLQLFQRGLYSLDVKFQNVHKKFNLEFGIRDESSNTDYKLFEIIQEFNHDAYLLSRPTVIVWDGLEKKELYREETTNPKFSLKITNKTLTIFNSIMQPYYTFSFITGSKLYIKLKSDSEENTLSTDLILTRKNL